MRISDWSSDVCSSDLAVFGFLQEHNAASVQSSARGHRAAFFRPSLAVWQRKGTRQLPWMSDGWHPRHHVNKTWAGPHGKLPRVLPLAWQAEGKLSAD